MRPEEIARLLELPLADLTALADRTRRESIGPRLDLCAIVNAKSGLCDQDCKFCAQSSRHATKIERYPLISKARMLEAAQRAKTIGAERFGIVTSGDSLSDKELAVIADAIRDIKGETGLAVCASLGTLDEEAFRTLKNSGLGRYHHNIETSRNYFSRIVTTHTFEQRVDTIRLAKKAGLEVCSGGIIGMGETMHDRIDVALYLKELDVDSVPINVLIPIKNTPLGSQEMLSADEAIRTIALFRIILKDKTVKVAAGREAVFKDSQSSPFMAGANGMIIGGYLTVKGRDVSDDRMLVDEIKSLWQR